MTKPLVSLLNIVGFMEDRVVTECWLDVSSNIDVTSLYFLSKMAAERLVRLELKCVSVWVFVRVETCLTPSLRVSSLPNPSPPRWRWI